MRKFWKTISLRIKIALALSLVALIAAIVGCFILKSEMRVICWACLIIVWVIDYWIVAEDNFKLNKEQNAKDYEIESLKWSYRQMGRYINNMHIAELSDIDFRIENELRDIEIKKGYLFGDKS